MTAKRLFLGTSALMLTLAGCTTVAAPEPAAALDTVVDRRLFRACGFVRPRVRRDIRFSDGYNI